jgi:hypothetical protein
VAFEPMISFQLKLPALVRLHVYHLMIDLPLQKALLEL